MMYLVLWYGTMYGAMYGALVWCYGMVLCAMVYMVHHEFGVTLWLSVVINVTEYQSINMI